MPSQWMMGTKTVAFAFAFCLIFPIFLAKISLESMRHGFYTARSCASGEIFSPALALNWSDSVSSQWKVIEIGDKDSSFSKAHYLKAMLSKYSFEINTLSLDDFQQMTHPRHLAIEEANIVVVDPKNYLIISFGKEVSLPDMMQDLKKILPKS